MAGNPVTTSFGPMVLTGMGSSSIGDQAGNALSEVASWIITLSCHCAPPPAVIGSIHTLCVLAVVGSAFAVHYQFVKPKQGDAP